LSQQSFFIKIKPDKKDELVRYITNNHSEISLKIADLFLKSKIKNQPGSTSWNLEPLTMTNKLINEEVVCTFDTKEDKYIFKTTLNASQGQANLNVPAEIFRIQRRNDFRVDIPTEVKYTCKIRTVNKKTVNVDVTLEDLSLGGCKVTLPENVYKMESNCQLELTLQMNQFESDELKAISRNVKLIENQNVQRIGLQFLTPDADTLADLHALLVYLDRVKRGKGYD